MGVYHRFTTLADDRKKGVSDEEILALATAARSACAAG